MVQLPNPLQKRHHTVAKALAEGTTNKRAGRLIGVSESTVIRWKREPDFQDLIYEYTPENQVFEAIQAENENFDLLQEAREAEILLTVELRDALEKTVEVVKRRLNGMSEDEMDEMPIRNISPLLKLVSDGLATLQSSHDRLTGYGVIIKEMESILEKRNAQNISD